MLLSSDEALVDENPQIAKLSVVFRLHQPDDGVLKAINDGVFQSNNPEQVLRAAGSHPSCHLSVLFLHLGVAVLSHDFRRTRIHGNGLIAQFFDVNFASLSSIDADHRQPEVSPVVGKNLECERMELSIGKLCALQLTSAVPNDGSTPPSESLEQSIPFAVRDRGTTE